MASFSFIIFHTVFAICGYIRPPENHPRNWHDIPIGCAVDREILQ
jgi:hypothetical protein